MNQNIWYKVSGVITPGGDPYFECPVCHGDGHCYGVEHEKNYHHKCNNCGKELIYSWEKKMTPEEAIKVLKTGVRYRYADTDYPKARDIAIEALEKQSHICSNCKYFNKDLTYTCTEVHLCTKHTIARYENAFCSDWENRDE